jgi:hypothetical protein
MPFEKQERGQTSISSLNISCPLSRSAMALRIWVTSLIDTPERFAVPAESFLPSVWGALSNPGRAQAPNPMSRPALLHPGNDALRLAGVWPPVRDFFGTPLVHEP